MEEQKQFLSIPELVKQSDIPESTVRRYLSNYPDYFFCKIYGRVKRYAPESIDLLHKISRLYDEGRGEKEIKEILNMSTPQFYDVPTSDGVPEIYNEFLRTIEDEQRKALDNFKKEISEEMERQLEKQREAIMENIQAENRLLLGKIEAMREKKDPEEHKGIFSRIFGRK